MLFTTSGSYTLIPRLSPCPGPPAVWNGINANPVLVLPPMQMTFPASQCWFADHLPLLSYIRPVLCMLSRIPSLSRCFPSPAHTVRSFVLLTTPAPQQCPAPSRHFYHVPSQQIFRRPRAHHNLHTYTTLCRDPGVLFFILLLERKGPRRRLSTTHNTRFPTYISMLRHDPYHCEDGDEDLMHRLCAAVALS
jgi:hypothetical protein